MTNEDASGCDATQRIRTPQLPDHLFGVDIPKMLSPQTYNDARVYIQGQIDKFSSEIQNPPTDGGIPAGYSSIGHFLAAKRMYLRSAEIAQSLLRPNTPGDILYRKQILDELPGHILEKIDPALPIRFHASPIDSSLLIIESNKIVTSQEAEGGGVPEDPENFIQVSCPHKAAKSISQYTEGRYLSKCIPMGCIFVVTPASQEEELESATDRWNMRPVNFDKEPHRLVAVLASSEMKEIVKEWMSRAGQDPQKVFEYEEGIEALRILKRDDLVSF